MRTTLTPLSKYAFGTLLAVNGALYAVRLWPHADNLGLAAVLFVLSTIFIGLVVGLHSIRLAADERCYLRFGSLTNRQALVLEFVVLSGIIVLPALYRMSLFVD
jgi:hypothetical protein